MSRSAAKVVAAPRNPVSTAGKATEAGFNTPGRPLAAATRAFMESHFNADFSQVRIHTGDGAASSARELGAQAYTVGTRIAFDQGRYAPDSRQGRKLLAHELSHVVQQSASGPGGIVGAPQLEREAEAAAAAVESGRHPPSVRARSELTVARAPADPSGSSEALSTAEDSTEAFDENVAQRGFDFVGDLRQKVSNLQNKEVPGSIPDLERRLAAATAPAEQAKLSKRLHKAKASLDRTKERLQKLSVPQLKDEEKLAKERERLKGSLDQPLTPGRRARVERNLASVEKQIAAVQFAKANPDAEAPLEAFEGVMFGSPKRTFVTIQVTTSDGVLHTFQAGNVLGADHAERVVKKQIEAAGLTEGNRLAGAKMVIFGDQEVCDECAGWLPKFGADHKLASVEGYTTHARRVDKEGDIKAKSTMLDVSNPKEVAKRLEGQSGDQGASGQPQQAIRLTQRRTFEWRNPGPPPAAPIATTATSGSAVAAAPPVSSAGITVARQQTSPKASTPPSGVVAAPAASVVAPQVQPAAKASQTASHTSTAPPPKPKHPPTATSGAPTVVKRLSEGAPPPAASLPATGGATHDTASRLQHETVRQTNIHGVGGPGQLGAAGSAEVQRTQAVGDHLQVHQSVKFEGRVRLEAHPEPNTEPLKYRVTLFIDASAGASVGGSTAHAVGGGVKATAGGSIQASFSHLLTEEETRRYVDAAENGRGGVQSELQVARLISGNRLDEARSLLAQMHALRGSAQGVADQQEGDRSDIVLEGHAGAEIDASAARGGGKAGVSLGATRGGSVRRIDAIEHGKHLITLVIAGQTEGTLGVSGSNAYAGGGFSGQRGTSTSNTVTFALDMSDKDKYAADLAAVSSIESTEQLAALKERRRDLVAGASHGQGRSHGTQVHASVLGADFGIQSGGSLVEETGDETLRIPYSVEGSGTGGASLALGGRTVGQFTQTDTFRGSVDSQNKGSGEVQVDKTEIDYSKTASAIAKNPLEMSYALATGGDVLQKSTHSEGGSLSDQSYDAIAALAKNGGRWSNVGIGDGIGNLQAWQRLRPEIEEAGEDRKRIAKLLAEFVEGDSRRGAIIQRAIGGTSTHFEFPDELADKKPLYEELVINDPVAAAAALGDDQSKLAALRGAGERLKMLDAALSGSKAEAFSNPAIYVEMRKRIDSRRIQLRKEISRLAPKKRAGVSSLGDKGQSQPASDVAGQEVERRENLKQDVESLVNRLRDLKGMEAAYFARMESEFKGYTLFGHELPKLSKPDAIALSRIEEDLRKAYREWDPLVTQLKDLLQQAGLDPAKADELKPNRARFLELDARMPGREYGSGLPGYKEV